MKCSCGNEFEAYSLMGVDLITKCPDCRQRLRQKFDEQELKKDSTEIASRRLLFRQTCGIPPKFINQEFGTFEQKKQQKAYNLSLCFAKSFDLENYHQTNSLMLVGACGLGKTHLACAIGHHILNKWQGTPDRNPIKFISEPDLFRWIQSTFSNNQPMGDTEQQIINFLISVPLLIVDDVGKEERADGRFVQRTWFSIVNGRYDNELPIVFTTNKNIDQLHYYFGGGYGNDAVMDRLDEMVKHTAILEGQSYRRCMVNNAKHDS